MTYKAFQDWYHEASIKHLLLYEDNGYLVSPPFATEKCKEYNRVLYWQQAHHFYIDLDLPAATSKTNAVVKVDSSLWLIPYGIYDEFDVVVQLKDFVPVYHKTGKKGKGQFYSACSNGEAAFSFPLGYEGTNHCLHIRDNILTTVEFDKTHHTKLHMGCVYANGKFWSMPRGDTEGYINIVSFDGYKVDTYPIKDIDPDITRKYTDAIVKDNVLYTLPYGEVSGLNDVVEFNTDDHTIKFYPINGPDFAKKYNAMVMLDEKIIGVPYGDEYCQDSNLGIVFDTVTKEISQFDIGIYFGGKYRYRCGIAYKGFAFFFPAGTPSCPILKISKDGEVLDAIYLDNKLVGRPVLYNNQIFIMSYNITDQSHSILSFDQELNYKEEFIL